ncbi:MAG TPA: patatin-like phospholipase family protein [Gemmatimonadaceae bacterium]|nr:patatin-like phospholipase family protein [Gemmatimonadaceae bacterium]
MSAPLTGAARESTHSAGADHHGKLGLSLAGGGFRASLFHLGVLHRLAELDLLRRVELISTVSGGSIIGILYVLLVKKHLEGAPAGRLSRDEYIALVEELDRILTHGVQRNLRTRLLLNPLGVLLALTTGDTLSRRMGRIYERYLLEPIVREMRPDRPWWERLFMPGRFPLRDLVMKPGGRVVSGGIDAYNARQRAEGGSVVTGIIINATTLNSGGRFFFTAVELGDWYLGAFRAQELPELLARKTLLQKLTDEELDREVVKRHADPASTDRDRRVASLARWWRRRRRGEVVADPPAGWERLAGVRDFPGELGTVALGRIRGIKVAAWYLVEGPRFSVDGGRTPAEHWALIAEQTGEIDPELWQAIVNERLDQGDGRLLVAEFLLELYYLRTAEAVSWRFGDDWRRLRAGSAMGASACFPPAFPPFLVYGIYDDLHVARLGLTDGGVYDNAGVTALVDEGCSAIIASDTGGTFDVLHQSPTGRIGLALRVPSVLMRVLGGTQRAALRERRRVSRAIGAMLPPPAAAWSPEQRALDSFRAARRLDDLAYFHIASPRVAVPSGSPPPIPSTLDPHAVACLRTDLDGFGDAEIAALVNHGYDMADRYVRRYLPALGDAARWAQAAPEAPKPLPASTERLDDILLAGRSRFFRALALRAVVSWAFTIAAVAAVVVLVARSGVSLARVLRSAAGAAVGIVTTVVDDIVGGASWVLHRVVPAIPEVWSPPASERPLLLTALVALAGLVFLLAKARRPREGLRTGRTARAVRLLVATRKWARALSGNVLWVVWGLPALVAGAASVLAAVSYVFYHLPFMRATSVPPRAPAEPGGGVTLPAAGYPASGEARARVESRR